jgi:hypothetical protein
MSDELEILGQAVPPSLSPEMIAYERGLLADPAFCRDHPQHAAMIRATLDEALQATGWQPPAGDPRTPAQQLHDRTLGVEPRSPGDYEIGKIAGATPQAVEQTKQTLAALRIDPVLGAALARDMLTTRNPDPVQVARQFDAAGINYAEAIAGVQWAFDRADGVTIRPQDLGAWALAQLHVWSRRLQEHAQGRH